MAQLKSLFVLLSTLAMASCNATQRAAVFPDTKFFEYELPNRTVMICPTFSLISLVCPQVSSSVDPHSWQPHLPKYLLSIDYIRSFPSHAGFEPGSCQPDMTHACHNYDLRYLNTLCNGKSHCTDIPAYQIRDRSLCAFKAVTEIGYHCVPTWHLNEIQTKCDICKNGSLTNDYGFIYSRNYPARTARMSCYTTIYARPNHKTVLYFVNGELNFDQLIIESVTSTGLAILNISLNGNLTTQRLAESIHELKITYLPSHIYSYNPTYYLLYFYTIPICTYTDPCAPLPPPPVATTPFVFPLTTTRVRIQSAGWTKVRNIWIIVPIILAYILLLLLVIVLALLFQRRRKQRKLLQNLVKTNLPPRYMEASGTSSRSLLVTPLPPPMSLPPTGTETMISTRSSRLRVTPGLPYPMTNRSFSQNLEQYQRESRSDYNLHQSSLNAIDYRHQLSSPYREHSRLSAGYQRAYDTMDYPSYNHDGHQRRPLPKSFSDCDLCKRRVVSEEYQSYYDEQDENWQSGHSIDRRRQRRTPPPPPPPEPRAYREKIKERFRERLTVRKVPDTEQLPSPSKTVEYSTVLPRHQRAASESTRALASAQQLPFEYIPSDAASNNIRTVEYKRNAGEERVAVGSNPVNSSVDEIGATNFTVKFYERDDNEAQDYLDRRLHDAREVQEMSMRMSEQQQQQQQQFTRHQYQQQQQQTQQTQQQRRFTGSNANF